MKLAAALLLCASGCSQRTDLLPPPRDDGGAGCSASIHLGNQAPCAGALAANLLRYSLCSCSALVLEHGLFTEGPPPGPRSAYNPSASVGTDELLQVAGPVKVGGSLSVAGTNGASFSRTSALFGRLHANGPVIASQFLSVGDDAFVNGDVLGHVDISNTLHVPMSANIAPSVSAGAVVREPVKVPPPCDCGASPPFDLPALVTAHSSINDNAPIGLAADALAKANGPTQLTLPCGEYYLSAIDMPDDAELELVVKGRAALFVGGDVALGRGLRVTLADNQSTLDLVVAGNLTVSTGMVGALAAESVRLWLASMTVRMGSGASFSAAVYAPGAVLLSDDDLSVRGALFAASLSIGGDLDVQFDGDILYGGAVCGAMPPPPLD